MRTYTAFVQWGDDIYSREEIDVIARDEVDARPKAQAILESDYIPGGRIIAIEPLSGCVEIYPWE